MSMFDSRLQSRISDWGTDWGSPERIFKSQLAVENTTDGEVRVYARPSGSSAREVCRISQAEWNAGVLAPASATRNTGSHATRFFLYHWMEERNMLSKFFNTLNGVSNA
jgi:hypothetical protein